MKLIFLDEFGSQISDLNPFGTYNSYWTLFSEEEAIPVGTKSIKMILMGTRYAGDDNDSYFDDLFLRIYKDQLCFSILGDINDDAVVNVQDIIILVNMILAGETDSAADLNSDGIVNVLDVIQVVNIILN